MATRKRRRAEETSLSKAIQQTLKLKGARVIRIQSGILPVLKGSVTAYVHCASKGTPDLLAIRNPTSVNPLPRFVFIEVKAKKGERNKDQREFALWASLNGVRCVEVKSVGAAVEAVFGSAL